MWALLLPWFAAEIYFGIVIPKSSVDTPGRTRSNFLTIQPDFCKGWRHFSMGFNQKRCLHGGRSNHDNSSFWEKGSFSLPKTGVPIKRPLSSFLALTSHLSAGRFTLARHTFQCVTCHLSAVRFTLARYTFQCVRLENKNRCWYSKIGVSTKQTFSSPPRLNGPPLGWKDYLSSLHFSVYCGPPFGWKDYLSSLHFSVYKKAWKQGSVLILENLFRVPISRRAFTRRYLVLLWITFQWFFQYLVEQITVFHELDSRASSTIFLTFTY